MRINAVKILYISRSCSLLIIIPMVISQGKIPLVENDYMPSCHITQHNLKNIISQPNKAAYKLPGKQHKTRWEAFLK